MNRADERLQRERQLLFASEAAHIQAHYARWDAAFEKLKQEMADRELTATEIADGIQLGLDFVGFAPGVGIAADVLNAVISAGRGKYGEALFNLAAAVPFFGDGAKGAKMLAKGVGKLDEVAAMSSAVAKNGDKAKDILKAGDEAGGELYDDVDFLLKEMDELKSPKDLLGKVELKQLLHDDILFNKHLEDLIDSHHGTPRQVIEEAWKRYKVSSKDIMGKAGQPNLVDVAREMHKLGHAGKLNGLPKYNSEFFRRLDAIKDANKKVTADVIWRVRDEMLRLYFGIGS